MFAKKIYDINSLFENGVLTIKKIHLAGYTTQHSFTGFTLKNKNKFNILKPDIQISFDEICNKVTVTANSISKFLFLLGFTWIFLMIALFAIFFITGEFAYAIKFWFGVIIGTWILVPLTAIIICILFRKSAKHIFEEIYSQIMNQHDQSDDQSGDGSKLLKK